MLNDPKLDDFFIILVQNFKCSSYREKNGVEDSQGQALNGLKDRL